MALNISPRAPVVLARAAIPADQTALLEAFDRVAAGGPSVDVKSLPRELRAQAQALIGTQQGSTGGLTNGTRTGSAVAVRTVDAVSWKQNPKAVEFRRILDQEVVSTPNSGMAYAKELATTIFHTATGSIARNEPTTILLSGEYGSGKSIFANAIPTALGISPDDSTGKVVRIDCGSLDVSTFEAWLKGTSPGYVGFGQQSPLTKHTEVILVDDLDKISPDDQRRVLAALNGLMGNTPVQLGSGETVHFKGMLVVSGNFGADEAAKLNLKGAAYCDHCAKAAIRQVPGNIASRLASGGVIGIEPVDGDMLKAIGQAKFDGKIRAAQKVLDEARIDAELKVAPQLVDALAECTMTESRGARPLAGLINMLGSTLFSTIVDAIKADKAKAKPLDDQRFELQLKGSANTSAQDALHAFVDAIRENSKGTDLPTLPPQYLDPSTWPMTWVDQTSTARFAPASKPPFAVDGAVAVPLGSGTSNGVSYVVVDGGTGGSENQMFFVRKDVGGDRYIEVTNFPPELKTAKAFIPVQCCDIDDKRSLFVGYNFTADGNKQAFAFLLDGETGQFKAIKAPPVRQGAAVGGNNGFAVLFSGRDPVFNAATQEWSVPIEATAYDLNGQTNVGFAHVYDPNIDEWLPVPLPPRQVGRATESDARSFATPIAGPDGTIGFAFGERQYRPSQAQDEVTLSRDSDWFTVIDPKARRVVHQGNMGFAATHVTAFLGNDGRPWMAGGFNLVDNGTEMVPRTGIYSQNPRSGRWHEKGELPGEMVQASMVAARHPDGIVMGPLDPSADAPNGFVVLQR